eukprot:1182814-Prorocentrum_minimum.AAC.3
MNLLAECRARCNTTYDSDGAGVGQGRRTSPRTGRRCGRRTCLCCGKHSLSRWRRTQRRASSKW